MTRLGWVSLFLMFAAVVVAVGRPLVHRPPDADTEFHSVGLFPDNMSTIMRLVENTKDHLTVVADFCAYGSYSRPKEFAAYKRALIALGAANKKVILAIYDDQRAREATRRQFLLDDPNKAQEEFDNEKQTARFKEYFDYHANEPGYQVPTTPEQFVDITQAEENQCVHDLNAKNVRVRSTINSEMAVFMWIRDSEEAVVSIHNFGPGVRESSFSSKNRTFVNILTDIAVRNMPK